MRTLQTGVKWTALAILAAAISPAAGYAKPKGAPPPPPNVRKFPKPTTKPPVARIIQLKPGQKRITPEQLRSAPSVDAANRKGKVVTTSPHNPNTPSVPGAPAILRGVSANPPTKVPPTPQATAKTKPGTRKK